jgi:hypothetical protein
MGGSDRKTNQLLEQQRRQQASEHAASMAQQQSRSDDAYRRQNQMFDSMFGGLDRFIKTGGIDDAMRNNLASGRGASGGGYYSGSPIDVNGMGLSEMEGWMRDSISGKTVDTNRLRAGNPKLEALMQSGGYSPEMLEELGNNVGMLNSIAATGGVDPGAMQRMRGMGVFDEYAQTGGIDARTEAMMRDRATSGIPAMYDNIKRAAGRNAALTGSTAGNAALMSKNAREQAQALAGASRDAELGIFDRRDEGRRWGASSAAGAEGQLQNLISSNRMNALNSAIGANRGIEEFRANMGFGAAKQLNEGEIPIQQMLIDERRYGIGGMEKIIQERIAEAQRQQAMEAAAAAAANADARYLMEYGNDMSMSGIKGMMGLYGMRPGEVDMYNNMELARRGLNMEGQNANIDRQWNNRSRIGENLIGLAGSAAGVAGGFLAGGGGFSRGLRPGQAGYGVLRN